jgi:PAS domain S-box-containing protein
MDLAQIGGRDAASRDTTVAAVWRRLDRLSLTAGAVLAPLGVIAYVVGYVATGQRAFLVMMAISFAVGVDATWRLARQRHDASILFLLSGAATAVAASLVPAVVRGATTAALVMIAVAATLVLPRRARSPVVATMGALLLAQLAWPAFGLAEVSEAVSVTLIGVFTMVAGISAVGAARSMLEESEQTRIEIFRRVPVGLFRVSPSGRIIDANPALEAMLGFPTGEMLGRSIEDLHASPEEWRSLALSLDGGDRAERFAHRWIRPDGSSIWVRGSVQAIRDGETLYHEGAVEDVTQRREVARRLDELRASGVTDLREHLEASPDETRNLISLIEFLDVNTAGMRLIGATSRDDALDRVVPVEPPPELVASFVDQFVAVWENRDHLSLEMSGATVDGEALDLALHWAATRTSNGELDVTRVIVAIVDIGVMRRAERDLEALVASKDELVASVSHELRTPITTIFGMAFELRDNAGQFTREESRELIEIIAEQSRELSNIVEDLLVAARADLNTLAVRPEVIDLEAEIAQVVASTSPEAVASVDVPTDLHAWADALRFRQIIRNLLTNASRYGGETVSIRARIDDGVVSIEVADSGPGIADADREAIFQPYVRAAADHALPGSIGLGLPVSRRLARLMGGDLVYRHDDESVFEVTLPAAARRAIAV